MNDITLGRYFPGNSFVHKLDPRTKIVMAIAFMVIVFAVDRLWLFIPVAAFVYLIVLCTRIPIKSVLISLKPLRWILLIMFIINLFMMNSGKVLIDFWIFTVSAGSLERAFFITFRMVLLVLGTSVMTLTTTPIALTDGLESLLKPLKLIRVPVHELSMMMTIALRFIPTLLDEADRITKAQLARGADFESGSIFKRAKAMIPIMIPLFVSAFRRADELALAMDSRCYHGDVGRTRMKVLKLGREDVTSMICLLMFLLCIFAARLLPF